MKLIIDLKKGGMNPQTPPGSLRLIWAPPPLPPPSPCEVDVSPLAHVALFYFPITEIDIRKSRALSSENKGAGGAFRTGSTFAFCRECCLKQLLENFRLSQNVPEMGSVSVKKTQPKSVKQLCYKA
jgi:hypothetical protein